MQNRVAVVSHLKSRIDVDEQTRSVAVRVERATYGLKVRCSTDLQDQTAAVRLRFGALSIPMRKLFHLEIPQPGLFRRSERSMQHNSVKTKLYQGGSSIGTMMFEFRSQGAVRATAAAGCEYALFDMEHTGWSYESIKLLCEVSHGTSMIPMVRVPAAEYHFIARVLDVGAMGVMVPMVESVEQAQKFVQFAKYPPVGRRGSAFGIAHDGYTGGSVLEKMQTSNEQVLLIAQIETAAGLNCVEEIAAVPGIDVLWIGQFDLSASLGIPGQFTHPTFVAAVDRVIAACNAHGKIGGFMTTTLEFGEWVVKKGFRMLAWSGDIWVYQSAMRQGLDAMRKFAGG